MPLVAVCSVKGRPGATTVALGLASVLSPQSQPVVMECDPAGGDLVARHRLTVAPGLVEVAAATRSSPDGGDVLSRYTQRVRLGRVSVDVVAAPAGGAQTRVALSVLSRPGRATLTPPDRVLVADLGRLDFSSPAWPVLGLADAVLLLVRGRVDEVAHLRAHVDELVRAAGPRLAVVLAPGGVYGAEDVADALRVGSAAVPVLRPLPDDRRAAGVLGGELVAGRRWLRLPLMTALAQLACDLPNRLPKPAGPSSARADAEAM